MPNNVKPIELEEVVVRFSGDSGDGMQLTGSLFSDTSAHLGNDISTFPDYPAEIRAPQGTIGGVSGFQVHLGHSEVYTPGDQADVLVAMNPAALKANRNFIKPGGTIIMDVDSFDEKNLAKAGYKSNDPIAEDNLEDYNIIKAPISTLTKESLKEFDLDNKAVLRSKNMYALGLVSWLFNRPLKHTEDVLNSKFKHKEIIAKANIKVLNDGYNYGVTIQALTPSYQILPGALSKGKYRNLNGNTAIAWGLMAAAEKAGRELFLGTYPITPASEILQELSGRKDLGVKVFQAEDEIAGICTAIGASFAGDLGVTSTSGPGLALKGEAIGLAIMAELPLVIVNVQRGGPSTGLPTKTEQSDLLQALFGRNGESPCVVMAASTPADCFKYAYWASKISIEHMTPVILLSDGFLANGSQPWKVVDLKDYPEIKPPFVTPDWKDWKPYVRDKEKLSRYWAIPGMTGFEHRLGGLEKDGETGNVSYDPLNHHKMVQLRQDKVEKIADFIPELKVWGDEDADTLVVSWGGTFGHMITTVESIRRDGKKIALAHFNFINPLPKNTEEVLAKYKKIVVCELNLGQFASFLRMKLPQFKYEQYNKVQGLPFTVNELKENFLVHIK